MATEKVGIREFRENLATYLLESTAPLAVTRHGDTIGFYIPVRRKRTDAERAAFEEARDKWQKILEEQGIEEEEVMAEYKQLKAEERNAQQTTRP